MLLRALDAAACSRGADDELSPGGIGNRSGQDGVDDVRISDVTQLPQHPTQRFNYNALASPVIENG